MIKTSTRQSMGKKQQQQQHGKTKKHQYAYHSSTSNTFLKTFSVIANKRTKKKEMKESTEKCIKSKRIMTHNPNDTFLNSITSYFIYLHPNSYA